MWALRRSAASSMRGQNRSIMLARACCNYSKLSRNSLVHDEGHCDKGSSISGSCIVSKPFSSGRSYSAKNFLWRRDLSSHVGDRSGQTDDDLEDGFSELEVPLEADAMVEPEEKAEDEELMSEGEMSEEDSDGADLLDLSDGESDSISEKRTQRRVDSPLFKIIKEAPQHLLNSALDKWVEEGNPVGRGEISLAILNLRKRRLHRKALQFVEWLEANKRIEFVEHDYATHLDLVAKVYGLQKAENYIEKIPESYRGEVVYRTLLANCVSANNVKKAEYVFDRIKKLGLPISVFSCNQLLLLYKWVDRRKIADVLLLMEKENVKPSLFTYRLLIDTKGRSNDISGMEQILDTMKAEGVEPDLLTQAMIAKQYIFAGLNEKAEAILEEIEGDDIKEKNRAACTVLLPLYAALGRADDVERVWNVCKSSPRLYEYLAAVEAWGRLGQMEKAEEVFENMLKLWKKLSAKYYIALLRVYANNKLLSKGKELVKRMYDNGCYIGPLTWDVLVKLYVEAGEVEKADSILHKSLGRNGIKPLFTSYLMVLDKYSQRGDIHNAEKMFQRLRQSGYSGKFKPFQLLLQAYINAKSPAYGFRERMKADNVFPNKYLAAQLAAADAFRKTKISELLD